MPVIYHCSVDGCDRFGTSQPTRLQSPGASVMVSGMCKLHYSRALKGMPVDAPRRVSGRGKTCQYEGCDQPWRSLGYCDRHYRRVWSGIPLDARGPRKAETIRLRDDQGRKHCIGCDQWLPILSFTTIPTGADKLRTNCKTCSALAHVAAGRTSPAYMHKISTERYAAMLAAGCEACGSMDALAVDHDHACCPGRLSCGQCVRGCLCKTCNTALGMLQDDLDRLSGLLRYLSEAQARVG